jgi:hypothetical protein
LIRGDLWLFEMYPALRAAQMKPANVLRQFGHTSEIRNPLSVLPAYGKQNGLVMPFDRVHCANDRFCNGDRRSLFMRVLEVPKGIALIKAISTHLRNPHWLRSSSSLRDYKYFTVLPLPGFSQFFTHRLPRFEKNSQERESLTKRICEYLIKNGRFLQARHAGRWLSPREGSLHDGPDARLGRAAGLQAG